MTVQASAPLPLPTSTPLSIPCLPTPSKFSEPATPHLTTKIYPAPSLPTQPFSAALNSLINAAYATMDDSDAARRLPRPTKLSEELGTEGFTAITFAHPPDYAPEEGVPVATASFKVWKDGVLEGLEGEKVGERRFGTDGKDNGETSALCGGPAEWELACVAVRPEERWVGKGLATSTIRAGECEATRRAREKGVGTVKLVVRYVKDDNEALWRRKGFVLEREQVYKDGCWGRKGDWILGTAVRYIHSVL